MVFQVIYLLSDESRKLCHSAHSELPSLPRRSSSDPRGLMQKKKYSVFECDPWLQSYLTKYVIFSLNFLYSYNIIIYLYFFQKANITLRFTLLRPSDITGHVYSLIYFPFYLFAYLERFLFSNFLIQFSYKLTSKYIIFTYLLTYN